ncbi:ADP-ribosyl cyclase/cyclic ADP-ribose hydrolase 1 [Amia ocellicauda]|uniref:ADP-ribosyl cyclase/cyclic ADP-ribose hydrolase 1 n=1 Tax=Amia ocellicauda TaxID=2972642 RepID=UPI003464E5F4
MAGQATRTPGRRRTIILAVCCCAVMVILAIAIPLAVVSAGHAGSLKTTVINRCQTFLKTHSTVSSDIKCDDIWDAFQNAFVGKDQCNVPVEAYDDLVNMVKQKSSCNNMLFWSKTKDIVHELTHATKCFITLEDTFLGFLMDNLTWCSKKDSTKIFDTYKDCPQSCRPNAVSAFWIRASANFAQSSCGNVTAMLNGSLPTPFSNSSIFGSVEVQNLNPLKVGTVNVVLIVQENDRTTCQNDSLQDLKKILVPGLRYSCKEVPISKIHQCIQAPTITCGKCWE